MKELIKAAQENEDLYMNRAFKANLGLIVERVCAMSIAGMSHEDIMSEMKVAFVKAVRGYNPDKGSFSTYLWSKIRGEETRLTQYAMHKERWRTWAAECECPEWWDAPSDDEAFTCSWPLDGLTRQECLIIELRLMGHSLTHIGKIMGYSAQYMRVLKLEAVKKATRLIEIDL